MRSGRGRRRRRAPGRPASPQAARCSATSWPCVAPRVDEAADAQRRAVGREVGLARGVAHVELGAHHALPLGGVLDPGCRLRRLLDAGDVAAGRALQRLHGEHRLGALRGARVVDLLGERCRALQLPQHSHGGQRYGRVPAMSRTLALALLLLLALPGTAAAALKARGSVEQVQVTGAKRGAKLMLTGKGKTVTKRAGKLGGAVFRDLKPGSYRLRGKRVRVLSDRSAPPSKKLYEQKIPKSRLRLPDHARRHQARDQRSPAQRARAVPDADRVRGLRLRQPGRRPERDQPDRQPARLRGRRRQHARHRLLGRRVRLLRAAPEPRRLRRDRDRRAAAVGGARQGRDGRRVLRRDQPAVRRPDAAPEPVGDHAAVGARQHADDAVSGRHPQHRLHARVGEGPRRRRASRRRRPAARRGRSSASRRATRPARPTRRCTPRRST